MIKKGSCVSLKEYIVFGRDSLLYCIQRGMVSYGKSYIVTRRYATWVDNIKRHYICLIGDGGHENRLPVVWFYDREANRDKKIKAILK